MDLSDQSITIANKQPDKEVLLVALLENYCSNPHTFDMLCKELVNQGVISESTVRSNETIRKAYLGALDKVLVKLGDDKKYLVNSYYSKNFTTVKRLGVGGFGSVYQAIHKVDGLSYAIKKVKLNKYEPEIFREVYYLARLNHPGVVRYYNTWIEYDKDSKTEDMLEFEDSDSDVDSAHAPTLYIQMELCSRSLGDYLRERTSVNKTEVNIIFSQIVEAVSYIHKNSIMHRDLKPDNIFLMEDGTVKIGDFGLARDNQSNLLLTDDTSLSVTPIKNSEDTFLTDGIGTSLYASPEQLNGIDYSFSTDVYSLGIIYYEMLAGFETNMERVIQLNEIRKGKLPTAFTKSNKEESKLISKMIHKKPSKRAYVATLQGQFLECAASEKKPALKV